MVWSTRELAELSGTTVNTIRHYHRLGLLHEPQRRYNGYKQYGIRDLVRLLRIRRLTDLGVPLSQLEEIEVGGQDTLEVLRDLDAELARKAERIQRARADIAAIVNADAPADAPAGFESVASRLSEADSSIIHIYARVYDDKALEDVRRMVETDTDTDALGEVLDSLPPDADERTRQELVERLVPILARRLIDYPWLREPMSRLSKTEQVTSDMIRETIVELYNPAQLDVLRRASVLADAQFLSARTGNEIDGAGEADDSAN